jgi:hypothetical protein
MAGQPVGNVSQPRSDTALFAHIAAGLSDVGVEELQRFATDTLQVAVGANAIRRARGTSQRIVGVAVPDNVIRPWLLVDAGALDFFHAIVRVRLLDQAKGVRLEQTAGVLKVTRLEGSRDVIVDVIYERRSDQRRLEAKLGEIAEVLSWEVVTEQSHEASVLTWSELAKTAAQRELLAST